MVMGCGLVTAGVTHAVTGFVPWCDLSARGRRPRPGRRCWPDQELDHPALAAPGVSHHSPAEPPSGPEPRPVRRRRERMTSLTDLREQVDVVIGVDTHVNTHSAAALDTATGGVLGEVTVEATTEGYAELVEFANNHATLRAWAIEGTSGHGAGLTRHLQENSEI